MIEVFSSGGGTQSNAICCLVKQGSLPKPDIIIIADTGREMPTTWQYLDSVTRPAMREIGIEIVRVSQEFCSESAKEEFHASGSLLIPAFSNQSGQASKLSAFCSNEWKQRVCNRYLKNVMGLERSECRKWIGFSFDETNRVLRMMDGEEYKKGLIRFPLVHDVPTRRHEAIRIVEKAGWPKPPRSRCWMCPNQSDLEWAEVKNDYPDLWDKAIALDESIRLRDKHAFLHSTIKPLREADLTAEDDLFSASCPSGECFL